MKRVKLFALPFRIIVGGQTNDWDLLQLPLVIVYRLVTPDIVHYWITDGPPVRSADSLAIVELMIAVVVAAGTSRQCSDSGFEVGAFVF